MTELKTLLDLEQQNPNDDKLLSQLAFYYLNNPDDDKELDYFKKAYKANPIIKNTHNYAFWLYYEYGNYELAQDLFKEILAKNPKSHYPYMAYAQSLLGVTNSFKDYAYLKSNCDDLIQLYQKALTNFNNIPQHYQSSYGNELAYIYNNLANVYLVKNEFDNAKYYYNLALTQIESCFDDNEIITPKIVLDENRYFILYNLLILAKITDNQHKTKEILTILKTCDSFDKSDMFYLKRKKRERLKRQLRYFYKCWLFGCKHCNNLVDDNLYKPFSNKPQ